MFFSTIFVRSFSDIAFLFSVRSGVAPGGFLVPGPFEAEQPVTAQNVDRVHAVVTRRGADVQVLAHREPPAPAQAPAPRLRRVQGLAELVLARAVHPGGAGEDRAAGDANRVDARVHTHVPAERGDVERLRGAEVG